MKFARDKGEFAPTPSEWLGCSHILCYFAKVFFLIIAMELQARLLIQVLFIPWGSWLAPWSFCAREWN